MSTPSQQTSHSEMNRRSQSSDRRQQPDRRHGDCRREMDRQPERLSKGSGGPSAQSAEKSVITTRNGGTVFISRPVAHALSEDELRCLLDHD